MTAPAAPPTPATPPADLPDRSDPATFRTRIFALWTWMTGAMVTDLVALVENAYNNALSASESAVAAVPAAAAATAAAASAINAPGTSATSTTSLAIGTGSKTLTIQTGKYFYPGQAVAIADSAAPGTNWMWGQVTEHNSGTGSLTVNVSAVGGSGTKTAWTVALSAAPGLGNKQDILVSGTNIKTVNGTSVLGAGNLTVGGAWTFLSSVTANNSATIDIETTFDSTYENYVIVASGVIPASTNVKLLVLLKVGGTYQSSSYFYMAGWPWSGAANTFNSTNSESATAISMSDALLDSASLISFDMHLNNPSSTTLKKMVRWTGCAIARVTNSSSQMALLGSGRYNGSTAALTGIRFMMDGGNITSGTFRLYGIKNS